MRKAIKYIMVVLAVLLLLVIALLALTQTAFFRNKLKDKLTSEAGKFLNLELSIDEINGNLFRNTEIVGINFIRQDSVVIHFDEIRLDYQIVPLIKGELAIDSIVLESPVIHLIQEKDSSWNISHFLVDRDKAETKKQQPGKLKINIGLLELNNGRLSIQSLSEMIPHEIKNFDLKASAGISGKDIEVELQETNFVAKEPDINLKALSVNFQMNEEGMKIENLVLRTGGSAVDAEAVYQSLENMQGLVAAEKIDRNEVAVFIPKLQLLCSPQVQTRFQTENDKLTAHVELKHDSQSVIANIQIDPFSKLVSGEGPVPYSANLDFTNFSIENWIELSKVNSTLEGTVDLQGKNLLDLNSNVQARANLRNSSYNDVRFHTLKLDGTWQNDNLSADLDGRTDFGHIQAKGSITGLSGQKRFSVDLLTDQFNVSAFFPSLDKTVLNGRIVASGKGFDPEKMRADADISLTGSMIYGFAIDTLNTTAQLAKSEVQIDSMQVAVPGASASGSGNVQLDSSRLDLKLQAHIDSLTVIDSFVQLPLRFDSVNTVTQLKGPFSELQIEGNAHIFNAVGYGAKLPEASTDYQVNLKEDSIQIAAQARANVIEYFGVEWDSMRIDVNYLNNEIDIAGRIMEKDTIEMNLATHIMLGDTMIIQVPQLEMNTLLSDYYLEDTLSATVMGTEKIVLNNLLLLDRNNSDFRLSANGNISTVDTNAFQLRIDELDLKQMNRFLTGMDSIGGILNAEFKLSGSSADPNISGTYGLRKPRFGNYGVAALNGDILYNDQNLSAELRNPELGEAFYAGFSSPLKMYLDSLQFKYAPPDTFKAEINLEDIQVRKYLAGAVPNDSLNGLLNATIEASGSFDHPQIYGNIRIDKALYQNKKLGLDYNNAKAALHFAGNKMSIDTFYIQQEKGLLSVTGELEFDSTIITGNIISSSLQADANNFYVARSRNYELLIDANTFVEMGQKNPEFGGNIKVLRSDIYLPAFITREIQESDENEPMLVQALNEKLDTLQSKTGNDSKKKGKEGNNLMPFKDITGRLNVEIPRNTWIRSEDMRLEIRGDVDIVKTGPYFELFGELGIERGHYILYGKKLNIKQSAVTFNGGEEFDPQLNFNAQYVYRGEDREKRYLDLLITGKLSDPQINFKLDDASITETDGMSVLLFGTTADQIGFGEQKGLVGSIGSNAVASLITSQLSKTLGAQLNLDMIEVTATENWKSAAFVVGKYITNDIFVIYQRGFGEEEGNEITPETITVEYELNDKLFLRLQSGNSITSGVDVILKFEQEDKK